MGMSQQQQVERTFQGQETASRPVEARSRKAHVWLEGGDGGREEGAERLGPMLLAILSRPGGLYSWEASVTRGWGGSLERDKTTE